MDSAQDKSVGVGALSAADAVGAPARLMGTTGIVMTALLGSAFFGLFYRWFFTQGRKSVNQIEDWGHAFVIPAISVFLLWRHREKLRGMGLDVFWPGLVPLALGVATYFAGIVTIQNHMLQGFAMILALFGVVLLLLGPRVMHYAFVPIAFMVFCVTISESIMEQITFQLKLIASEGSWILLTVLGPIFDYTVDLSGNTLHIYKSSGEYIPLNVADACSGMRMVVAFFALAGAVAVLGSTRWWQRIALMLLAGPVAVGMNLMRVTVLGLVSLADPELASGDAHMVIGTLLLIPSLMLFMGLVWVLDRLVSEPAEVRA
jgi:exosortase